MELIGAFGAFFYIICSIPELIYTIKNKHCNLQTYFILFWLLGGVCGLMYAISIMDFIVMSSHIFNILVCSVFLFYKVKK